MRRVVTQCPACGLKYAARAITKEAKRYQRRNGISASTVFTCPACDTQFEAYATGYEPRRDALRAWWNKVTWNYLPLKIYTVVFAIVLPGVFYVQLNERLLPEAFAFWVKVAGLCLIPAGMVVLCAMQSRFGCGGGIGDDDSRLVNDMHTSPAWDHFNANIYYKEEDH